MKINFLTKESIKPSGTVVFAGENVDFTEFSINEKEQAYISGESEKEIIELNNFSRFFYFINPNDKIISCDIEKIRNVGSKLTSIFNKNKIDSVTIIDSGHSYEKILALAEGMALSNYKFLKYFKDAEKKVSTFKEINIVSENISSEQIFELQTIVNALFYARDLGNEPYSGLNSVDLSEKIKELGKEAGFVVEVFKKKEIEANKMGGILAVNQGSNISPTFSVLKWEPKNAVNSKPYVLVGKGLVYDSGGYSLKPTKNSMDLMKLDMAGAASVIGAMYAVAKNNLPVSVIALIPSTDNMVNSDAYVPGDVIKMHNGLFVEVLNTDAEGRLILADALSYAQSLNPGLVVDVATLTGSAAVAVGTEAAVIMGTASDDIFNKLILSGENVYERVVKFPFWDEYKEMLKSNIADIKNVGGKEAGAITAGKFLEYFTDYPWIHIDIAGPSILSKKSSYRTEGGSGFGVRLLYDFLKNIK
ncbi:MAG: leucyl aminopeptidase [Bacteroidales bacterium]|nr:leucyl aminopeptidase [Bacteroidales bacterium]